MTRGKCLLWMIALAMPPIVGCSDREADEGVSLDALPVLEIDAVVPVRRSQITESLELVGTLYPWRFAAIVPEVDGVIARLPTHEKEIGAELDGRKFSMPIFLDIGHEVKEGSILTEIDKRPFQLELDAAEAKLDVATKQLDNLLAWKRREEVEQLEAQAEEADALLKRAKLDLERTRELRETQVVSKSEFDAALAAHDTAVAAKKRADAALRLANAGPTPEEIKVAEAQVALAKAEVAMRQDDLDKCTIYCPYDAVIVDRLAGVGDRVTIQAPIMQIIDPTYLLAQIPVPEKYQRSIKVNDLARVQAPGISQPVPGLVALVNEKIDPETRTFRVRVGVENPKPASPSDSSERIFKAGSYVRVTLSLKSSPDALVVPSGAMTFDGGQPAVFVFRGDHVQKRPVTLGISSRTHYEVTDGLTEGEQVVEGGTSLLADGLPVRLRPSRVSSAGPSPNALSRREEGSSRVEPALSLAVDRAGAQP
ncbi:MAG TPA: efflux RND transporter periplasmic adaptor subunit [Thermoguttaceae bacterium]|nr:efflux RND transporter periplasmic adaptor subunit [Thermoguttaceae bacterium]